MMAAPTMRASQGPDPGVVRGALGVSRERMARLLDVSTGRWSAGSEQPIGPRVWWRCNAWPRWNRSRTWDIRCIRARGFEEFLSTPLPVFEGRTALQTLSLGRADLVLAALAADYEGLGF